MDLAYKIATKIMSRPTEMYNLSYLPEKGPAILVANHIDSIGPRVVANIPRKLRGWAIKDVTQFKTAPAYVKEDYIDKELNLSDFLSTLISYPYGYASVLLNKGLGTIPVDKNNLKQTFRETIEYLEQDEFIFIFPENPKKPPIDLLSNMKPFARGIGLLGKQYPVDFYPIAIHKDYKLMVGEPIPYNENIRSQLENRIIRMYHEMEEYALS